MSVQDRGPSLTTPFVPDQPETRTAERRRPTSAARGPALAVLRIVMGLTFLWAFLDKLFGLGYSTSPAQAWISGGSPTKGFLGHVQVGPMQSTLRDWAGAGWADWLFMLALLGLGIALLLGVALRPAATAGTILLALMWIAEWPLAQSTSAGTATSSTNPLIDYHLVYLVVLIALAAFAAGDTWGLGHRWAKLDLVRRTPWLR
ncbi:DoxX family membrane protein [Amycolatopsis sp. NBC_01307]|uniref:DoxX family membrane protein n=1 Tax=Amycolatopsis sp. NBC_01307 TaxID=2903561 RepID=UPI002E0F1593|nr:DoxX family membrane protein [Amycolatopsis sp. NBC_01307]